VLGIYLAALAFGLVSIGASLFLHDGADAHDHDGHGDHHGDLLGTLLSLRFWSYTLGAFGMAGTALLLLKLAPAVHLPVAVALGLTVGGGTSWLFRGLRRMAGAPLGTEDLLGSEAEVVMALLPGKLGKVRVRKAEQELELMARGGEGETLSPKDRAVVIRFVDGVAEVRAVPWRE